MNRELTPAVLAAAFDGDHPTARERAVIARLAEPRARTIRLAAVRQAAAAAGVTVQVAAVFALGFEGDELPAAVRADALRELRDRVRAALHRAGIQVPIVHCADQSGENPTPAKRRSR